MHSKQGDLVWYTVPIKVFFMKNFVAELAMDRIIILQYTAGSTRHFGLEGRYSLMSFTRDLGDLYGVQFLFLHWVFSPYFPFGILLFRAKKQAMGSLMVDSGIPLFLWVMGLPVYPNTLRLNLG